MIGERLFTTSSATNFGATEVGQSRQSRNFAFGAVIGPEVFQLQDAQADMQLGGLMIADRFFCWRLADELSALLYRIEGSLLKAACQLVHAFGHAPHRV